MPKRKINDPSFISKDKIYGYTVVKGRKLKADGTTGTMRFLLGHDYDTAKVKKAQIIAEFEKLKILGTTTWTNEALDRLTDQGVISHRQLRIVPQQAIKLYPEPLSDPQLAPLVDAATKMIKPEHAIAAADLDARNVYTRQDVRGKFHNQILEQATADPLATFERLCRLFQWTSKEASQFLFNVTGNLAMQPIAFDASEPEIIEIDQGAIVDVSATDIESQ